VKSDYTKNIKYNFFFMNQDSKRSVKGKIGIPTRMGP